MKRLLLCLLLCVSGLNAQITNRLLSPQNVDSGINPPNIMYTVPPNDNRIYQTSRGNLLLSTSQITGLSTFITDLGNIYYKPLTYAPTSAEIISALSYTPFNASGLLTQYVAGDGSFINFPSIPANKNDIGLPNVDNTSDINKPLSNAMVLALASKLSVEVDGSTTNEIQTLSKIGDNLTISNGNTIALGIPVIKKQETFSGSTNASGQYVVTFSTPYTVAPNIQANIINATDTQNIRITSISTTGFTVVVRNRVDVIGLLPTWNNVTGANVDVLVTQK